MLEEIIVTVDDRPSLLADLGELLHLVVDDGEEAAETLAANGFKVEGTRSVMSVTLDDRPGELGRYCRRLSKAGVSISSVYLVHRNGGETELVFAVDNLEAATTA